MPDTRRIQGPEESKCPLLFLKAEEKRARERVTLLGASGLRLDGRKPDEMRPLYMKTGINPRATGSAYVELGSTKVLCAIYGPKESLKREEFQPQGKLTCEFKFASFSSSQRKAHQQDQEEKELTALIVQALERSVRLELFPKLQLEINIIVLENGGNALGASLLSATLALASSGVEMLDIPIATSVVQYNSTFLIDPSLLEEESIEREREEDEKEKGEMGKDRECGRVFLVYLPSLDEITSVKLSGVMQPLRLMTAVDVCIEGALRIMECVRDVLWSS